MNISTKGFRMAVLGAAATAALVCAGSLQRAAAAPARRQADSREQADLLVTEWHTAASRADEAAYFGVMTEHAVFLGTDKSERWDKAAFQAYAHPHFSKGKGWTFTPRERHWAFSADGRTAWWDELLDSEHLGVCRGSGVAVRDGKAWKIAHYDLAMTVPNDLASDLVTWTRAYEKDGTRPPSVAAAQP